MLLKEGVRVYCKKSYFDKPYQNPKFRELFTEGESYIVKKVDKKAITIYFDGANGYGWTTFINVSHETMQSYTDTFEWSNFHDYFYNNIETRRLKLERLNEI